MNVENCSNCERGIGKLEQAYIYGNHIVCKECYSLLMSSGEDNKNINSDDRISTDMTDKKNESPHMLQREVMTNVKQGAFLGGCVCLLLASIFIYYSSLWFIFYVPLLLAAFILSIVAMAQKRILGGVFLLLGTIVIPPFIIIFGGIPVSPNSHSAESNISNVMRRAKSPVTGEMPAQVESNSQELSLPNTPLGQPGTRREGKLTKNSSITVSEREYIKPQVPSVPIVSLGGSVIIDNIEITVRGARLGFIERKSIFGGSITRSDSKYLLIDLVLRNTSDGNVVYLQDVWKESDITDNYGNIEGPAFGSSYQRDDIVGVVYSGKLKPHEAVNDMMIFDRPLESASDFTIKADPGFWKSVSADRVRQLSDASFQIKFTRQDIQD
jgi:hypothetical protein